MLEAHAHQQLKVLLRQEAGEPWPHHLSLSRLVGRSLRRGDHSLIRLAPGSGPSWWISLLVPLALSETPLILVLRDGLRQRLLQVELPRLARAGLAIACAEGPLAPQSCPVWLMNHAELVQAWKAHRLADRQLILPEAEQLEDQLRQALDVVIEPHHWDQLRRARPAADSSVIALHERLSRRVLAQPLGPDHLVGLAAEDEAPLRQLLQLLAPLPEPWGAWLDAGDNAWTSWAEVNPALLQWRLHRQPLEPLTVLKGCLEQRGALLIGLLPGGRMGDGLPEPAVALGLQPQVDVALGEPPLSDPLPVYAPLRQPLPNSPIYADHLLEQCRRLVLGQSQLTVVLLDDGPLRRQLTSGLAAEFGIRVVHECTTPESHGVLCASWGWWLAHQERLPIPAQVVVGLLPIASLEDPLTAARVAMLRRQGRDWFRELLLPDALARLQLGVASLRREHGRLAILDGRLRGRSWGRRILQTLEPWVSLTRLLPR